MFAQLQGQVLDEYPNDQYFYKGGEAQFYKEIYELLENEKSAECSSSEIYQPRILVTKEGTVKQVKDFDDNNIEKNKCAYDLSLLVLKKLKNWNPAVVKGQKLGAITEFVLYPKDVMSNYQENYEASKYVLYAQYPGGNKKFNQEFHDQFMSLFTDYQIRGTFNLEFYIDQNGSISQPRIFPEIDNQTFNKEFLRTLSRMKKKWSPSLYSNVPIKQRISFPMNFTMEFIVR